MFGGLLQVARNELVTVARNELDDILENNVMDDGPTGHESQEEQAAYPDPAEGDAEAMECVEIPPEMVDTSPARTPTKVVQAARVEPVAEILCWGFLLRNDGTQCTPEFSATSGPFKRRICDICVRDGLAIDPNRIRIMTPDAAVTFQNSSSHGLWNHKARLTPPPPRPLPSPAPSAGGYPRPPPTSACLSHSSPPPPPPTRTALSTESSTKLPAATAHRCCCYPMQRRRALPTCRQSQPRGCVRVCCISQ